MLALAERGVTALLSPGVKLGADVGVTAGPVGLGAEAATANISADIVTYSGSKWLDGGVSLTGAVVAVRSEWNEAYYNKPGLSPSDIVMRETVTNPHAAPMLQALAKAAFGPVFLYKFLRIRLVFKGPLGPLDHDPHLAAADDPNGFFCIDQFPGVVIADHDGLRDFVYAHGRVHRDTMEETGSCRCFFWICTKIWHIKNEVDRFQPLTLATIGKNACAVFFG